MRNLKLKKVGERKLKDGNTVILTVPEVPKQPCKKCGKEYRRAGSSRCAKCAELALASRITSRRLQEKIDQARERQAD